MKIYFKKNEEEKSSDNSADKTDELLKNYKDTEGLTTRKLNFGLWYIEHRKQLRLSLIIFLAITAAASWSYAIYGFAYYIARGMNEDEVLTRQLVQSSSIGHDYVAQIAAKDLEYSSVNVLKSTDKKYDFIVKIKNPNDKWWAEFEYYFLASNKQTEKKQGFVLPGEIKHITVLAQDFAAKPSGARLIIENIKWARINQHKITDWDDFLNSHLAIGNTDVEFIPSRQSGLSEKIGLNQLSFISHNNTPYNYWQVDFIILLYSGDNIISVNKYGLTDFMSGEKRLVEASWPGVFSRVTKVEIVPEINIMEDDIYIEYEGGIGEEK